MEAAAVRTPADLVVRSPVKKWNYKLLTKYESIWIYPVHCDYDVPVRDASTDHRLWGKVSRQDLRASIPRYNVGRMVRFDLCQEQQDSPPAVSDLRRETTGCRDHEPRARIEPGPSARSLNKTQSTVQESLCTPKMPIETNLRTGMRLKKIFQQPCAGPRTDVQANHHSKHQRMYGIETALSELIGHFKDIQVKNECAPRPRGH